MDTPQRITEQSVRTVLGSFLVLRGDDIATSPSEACYERR